MKGRESSNMKRNRDTLIDKDEKKSKKSRTDPDLKEQKKKEQEQEQQQHPHLSDKKNVQKEHVGANSKESMKKIEDRKNQDIDDGGSGEVYYKLYCLTLDAIRCSKDVALDGHYMEALREDAMLNGAKCIAVFSHQETALARAWLNNMKQILYGFTNGALYFESLQECSADDNSKDDSDDDGYDDDDERIIASNGFKELQDEYIESMGNEAFLPRNLKLSIKCLDYGIAYGYIADCFDNQIYIVKKSLLKSGFVVDQERTSWSSEVLSAVKIRDELLEY